MLEAGPQAKLEHGPEGEHVRLAYVGVRDWTRPTFRGDVIDRVDPPGEILRRRRRSGRTAPRKMSPGTTRRRGANSSSQTSAISRASRIRSSPCSALSARTRQCTIRRSFCCSSGVRRKKRPAKPVAAGQQDLANLVRRVPVGPAPRARPPHERSGAARPRPCGIAGADGPRAAAPFRQRCAVRPTLLDWGIDSAAPDVRHRAGGPCYSAAQGLPRRCVPEHGAGGKWSSGGLANAEGLRRTRRSRGEGRIQDPAPPRRRRPLRHPFPFRGRWHAPGTGRRPWSSAPARSPGSRTRSG